MLRKTLDQHPCSLPYLLITFIAILLFFPTWARLSAAWLQFEQVLAHGLVTAVIFLGLLLIHPPTANAAPHQTNRLNIIFSSLLLLATTLAWALLELARIDTLAFLMLPPGLISVCWVLLGLQRMLSFLPYVALLALSLPVWADMVPVLVALASMVVGEWVRWFGMTALIEGNSITLPYGRLLIADGCSGIRYFAISILLAMMISILNDYRWKGWLASVSIAVIIGLLANWVRITILVVVAYQTNMQSDLLTNHEVMGWMVFGGFILPVLYFSPVRRRSSVSTTASGHHGYPRKGIAMIAIAFAAGPLALTIAQSSTARKPAFDVQLPGFVQIEPAPLPLAVNLPDTLEEKMWRSDNVWISLAQHHKRTANDKLVPYIPPLFDKSTWQTDERLDHGLMLYRNILTRERIVVAQWYQVGSHKSWKYREAKLRQIPALFRGESRFALITIQARCSSQHCQESIRTTQSTVSLIERQLGN